MNTHLARSATFHRIVTAAAFAALLSAAPLALSEDVQNFPALVKKSVHFWSDGTRLAGDLFYPKDLEAGDKLPAIVLCHGWGGTKGHLNRRIAPGFAEAGFVVFAFDYRGWGESNSRLIVRGDMPKPDENGNVTVEAWAIQQLVDPLDQQEDIDAAITFVEGESIVDASRIGIWGSSFGGGHVIWRAAHDSRVKCVVAQVGGMDASAGLDANEIHASRIARVRGERDPSPVNEGQVEGLTGAPYFERFIQFSPVSHAGKITAPTLIIDAEKEHYFDNADNGALAFKRIKGNAPVEYYEFEGIGHYDIYSGEPLKKAMKLETAWFVKHLKGNS